jgi:putative membrane protein
VARDRPPAGLRRAAIYLGSTLFWTKLGLFALVGVLEAWPMATLVRWRSQLRRGQTPDTSPAPTLYRLTHAEMALVIAIVFVASFMARGFGHR